MKEQLKEVTVFMIGALIVSIIGGSALYIATYALHLAFKNILG